MNINSALYLKALTHRSWVTENGGEDYEVLEFIGDAVLQLCISQILIEVYPTKNEGELSVMRHNLVNNAFLSDIAKKINLGSLIRLGVGEDKQGGRNKTKILASVYESLLGAVYYDQGFNRVLEIVRQHMGEDIKLVDGKVSAKKRLQEWSQSNYKTHPLYVDVCKSGPDHNLERMCFII